MFTLKIHTDNAAFHDCSTGNAEQDQFARDQEVARILHDLAETINAGLGCRSDIVRDANGNTVGEYRLTNR